MSEVRCRFAPSPTGFLHLGGARTALFSWLYTRYHGGTFVLRIEDTDRERSSDLYVQSIIESMQWLGLDWDEGVYFQSQRLDRYAALAQELEQQGLAYRCVCSPERLNSLREQQLAQHKKPRYDGRCRDQHFSSVEGPFVLRFKTPISGSTSFNDLIHGVITVENQELDDLILVRSDGVPTYNFCVVVDDIDMRITHVIRGDDHINNTPRQLHLFQALGFTPPHFAHVPMILGEDGQRMSKRHGAVNVLQYRDQGFLPQALLNYLARLGWSKGDQELFDIHELVQYFDVAHVHRAGAVFDLKKLLWFNQQYIRKQTNEYLWAKIQEFFRTKDSHWSVRSDFPWQQFLEFYKNRIKTWDDLWQQVSYLREKPAPFLLGAEGAGLLLAAVKKLLLTWTEVAWDLESLNQPLVELRQQDETLFKEVSQALRKILTGSPHAPSIAQILTLLGRTEALARISEVCA